jgi:ADP-ribose pyrophosphatase
VSQADERGWFETVDSRVVHDGHVTLRVDRVHMPDGPADREVVVPPDAVGVVALLGDDVVLVRQYRQPIGRTSLELPAGVQDVAGEDPLETGRRELAEECGLASDDWSVLTAVHTSPGWTTERVTLLLARDCRPTDTPPHFEATGEEAAMEVVRLPLTAAVDAVRAGTITDVKAALGLCLVAGQDGPRS